MLKILIRVVKLALITLPLILSFAETQYYSASTPFYSGLYLTDYVEIVYPRIYPYSGTKTVIQLGSWVLEFDKNERQLIGQNLRSEWVSDFNNTTIRRKLRPCDHLKGFVRDLWKSPAAVSVCSGEVTGYLNADGHNYFVQPLQSNDSRNGHVLYEVSSDNHLYLRRKRSSASVSPHTQQNEWKYFNLTGDTIDLGTEIGLDSDSAESKDEDIKQIDDEGDLGKSIVPTAPDAPGNHSMTSSSVLQWRREELDTETGYFYDTAWEPDRTTISYSHEKSTTVTKKPTPLWLEIAMAVDHTVISFHGRDMVEQYVLALLNIVNAIYQDSSLEANVQLVITRLLFFEHQKQSVIRAGNAKKSLENVNSWNKRLHLSLAPGETHHDAAIWLTRSDIGGPSGYAPIAGACDPKRSCALNRDEGLTSAFIIAHEMAHILGLSHDGDDKAGNDCSGEALEGSVMAPLVSATFHKFSWSKCSQKEFEKNSRKWKCLLTPPGHSGEIILNGTLQNSFSMDEQCRMEFGEGYSLCRAFDITEPCSHLWCGHVSSPLVCKTKKGPPLEGTECGFGKWCINGYCEEIDVRRFGMEPVIHNPQDGGWNEWSPWGVCSRSCGTGVEFRTRKCDNPSPSHGGSDCFGLPEEWRICNVRSCPEPVRDIRADQCSNIPKYLKFQDSHQLNMTWQPYESDQYELKCKLICISRESKELHITDENLIDGTPCSYENSSNICIQGTCHPLGCDGKLYSNLKLDSCGVCGGNNTQCVKLKSVQTKKLKRELSRLAAIPRLAREIRFEANVSIMQLIEPTIAFVLKNRRKKRYTVTIPNTSFHTEIIEGAKFYYKKYRNRHSIWANGPVLAEMVILIFAAKHDLHYGINVTSRSEYFVHKDWLNAAKRFHWKLGGWGPCSATCGGGKRHRTVACFDDQNNKIVRRKFCSLAAKPLLENEKCNTFSCDFLWLTGQWEPCNATCGSHGMQSRELYCVPNSAVNESSGSDLALKDPWRFTVSPNKCPGMQPVCMQPCNRTPCISYWITGEWSQCSTSCGTGISTRVRHCPILENETFYTCEEPAPSEKRSCAGLFTKRTNPLCRNRNFKCHGDQSKYCSLAVLWKYCVLKSFHRLCCKSCQEVVLQSEI